LRVRLLRKNEVGSDEAIVLVKEIVAGLRANGLKPELVSGGGTGSYYFESESELQCGS
jgi:3-hydroxy-D-aspartate aldolase